MGMGSECFPYRASGSAGGGGAEKQGGDGADNGGESLEEKKRFTVLSPLACKLCKKKYEQ